MACRTRWCATVSELLAPGSVTWAWSTHCIRPCPQSEGLLEPLATIEMPLARVLAEVEAAGIAASPQRLAAQT